MIEQLMHVSGRQFTESQIQLVGGYLTGQEKLEKVTSTLGSLKNVHSGHFYSSGRECQQIARECKKEPKLLTRVGRYLILAHSMSELFYRTLILQLLNSGLSLTEVFLDSGMDESWLIGYLLYEVPYYRHDIPGHLHMIARRSPKALPEYAKKADPNPRLLALAFLAGQGDLPRAGLLRDTMKTFTNEMKTAVDALLKRWGKEANGSRRQPAASYTGESPDPIVFAAFLLTEYKLPDINALARQVCAANNARFIRGLVNVLCGNVAINWLNGHDTVYSQSDEAGKQELEGYFAAIESACAGFGIPREYMCAFVAEQMLCSKNPWRDIWQARYRDVTGAALAASADQPATQVQLYLLLAELGQPLPLKICEELSIRAFGEGPTDAYFDQVAAWLVTGEGDPAGLPKLDQAFMHVHTYNYSKNTNYIAILSLPAESPVWMRYLWYTAVHHPQNVVIPVAVRYLSETRGISGSEIARKAIDFGCGQTLLLSAAYPYYNFTDQVPALSEIMRALALHNPGWVAAAMSDKGVELEARLLLLQALYDAAPGHDPAILFAALGDSSKKIREAAIGYLRPRTDLTEQVRALLDSKKKTVREAAQSLILAYEGASDLPPGEDDAAGGLVAYCIRHMPKNAAGGLAWALPGGAPVIRNANGTAPADEAVVLFYLHAILSAKSFDLPPKIMEIRALLNGGDLNALAVEIYEVWLAAGAPAKQKAAVLLYGVHAGDAQVTTLARQIEVWADSSRGALASDAVRALALGGSDLALMRVDSFSRKFKNKQVRRAAGEAFGAAAQALGVTPEVLGDRIIPTLGFDRRGEKVIDYGARQFTALLTPAMNVELRDSTGKKIASLPKPGAKDDAAQRAKDEFAALKKSLKSVVQAQSQRLEQALAAGRYWDVPAWEKLFVQNPIMHSFAAGLVWGVYDGEVLRETFRYMEDGSLTKPDEDEFTFDAVGDGLIGLVHPLDMDEDTLALWRQQFEDYDVRQPLLQLNRAVFKPESGETRVVERFAGKRMLGITLMGKLQKADWFKGSVQDAGGFNTMYREIGQVGAQVYCSYMYVSPMPDEVVTVGQVGFYQAGSINRGSYIYDEIKAEDLFEIEQLSPRLFSEIILDLTNATASANETDENWRAECEGWKIKE